MKIVYYSLSGNTKRMAELIADGIKMSGKDAELVDFESISAEEAANEEKEADIVYKAEAQGKEVVFYILLEFQSSVDYTMPLRLLLFLKLKPSYTNGLRGMKRLKCYSQSGAWRSHFFIWFDGRFGIIYFKLIREDSK